MIHLPGPALPGTLARHRPPHHSDRTRGVLVDLGLSGKGDDGVAATVAGRSR
jgi:hypothetical protein